ncbi:hypothetical protein MSAN_01513600 [Mycena sanguinolenta]|uniref:Uncharacterized protein n=1 Tax=Mycena sanguinolenta TaxID=230812 RepID=A0A8H6Y7H1_9AGAR|nr:hypothetical protein MSAN_01513600 [Mycena sanguinolenta]
MRMQTDTTSAHLERMTHGAPAGFGCKALQLLLPRPASERESVRAAVEARIQPVHLRVVVVGGSYGGANGSRCQKAYRNAFHSSPNKGISSAMSICMPARTALTAARTPHFTDEALKMQHGGKVPRRPLLALPPAHSRRFCLRRISCAPVSTAAATRPGTRALYAAAEMLGKRWWDSYAAGLPHPATGFFPTLQTGAFQTVRL